MALEERRFLSAAAPICNMLSSSLLPLVLQLAPTCLVLLLMLQQVR